MPITRNKHIELTDNYEDRVQKHVEKLLRVPMIRQMIAKPHPKQAVKSVAYSVTTLKKHKIG